jgi:hypothetical protein
MKLTQARAAVLAALIGGFCLIIAALPSLVPFVRGLLETPTPTPTITPMPTNTPLPPTPTPQQMPKTGGGRAASSWISCDANSVIAEKNFKWVGPDPTSCDVSLHEGEFVVGTADRFQETVRSQVDNPRCAAFLLKGPLQITLSIGHGGGGDYHSAEEPYGSRYFEEKWHDLDNHPTCNFNNRGYDKVTCTKDGCIKE